MTHFKRRDKHSDACSYRKPNPGRPRHSLIPVWAISSINNVLHNEAIFTEQRVNYTLGIHPEQEGCTKLFTWTNPNMTFI
jgi:hypothetical protein